jgi:cytochrome c oxidase subunit 3
MRGVTTARPASPATPTFGQRAHSLNRPNMVSVGTIIWLSSELMFFAGLFAMFFTVKAQNVGPWPPPPAEVDIAFSLPFTIVLVLSSFTCQWGVFCAERGDVFGLRRWYSITLVMGIIFLIGQGLEYHTLVFEHATTFSSSAWGSVFYISTGFHALHVFGGLVAFVLLMARTKMSKFTPAQATSAIVVSYYWHFVDIVWIALFACVEVLH